jgi:hypothetical protein
MPEILFLLLFTLVLERLPRGYLEAEQERRGMKSRFRGSANIGPYTTIVGFLREHGEVDTDFLAAQLVELDSSSLADYLGELEKAGAVERNDDRVRLADSTGRSKRRRLLTT